MRITSKGQVTIPQAIRESMGFLPETEVEFVVEDDALRLVRADSDRRVSRGRRAVRALQGAATVSMSTEDILALTRSE